MMMLRKSLLAAVAIVAICMPLSAQFVGCPDANASAGGGNTYPMGASTEWRYQQLVPASCLGTTAFKITDMAYAASAAYPSHPGTYANFEVRMALTTLTALTNNFGTNLGNCPVTVLNRPTFNWAHAASTWVDFGLDCKFGYDGVRNIVVEVRYDGGSSQTLGCRSAPSGGAYWRAYTRGPGARTSTTAASLFNNGVLKVRFTVDRTCVLTARADRVSIGTSGFLQGSQASPGSPYQIASAFGHATKIPFAGGNVCLDLDDLFKLSVGGNPLFTNYAGNVAANGTYTASFRVPALRALIGLCLSHASITVNPNCGSNTVTTEIAP